MTPYYETQFGRLYHGDNINVLPSIGNVDAIVTDPPYGIRFMGKKWDYDVPTVEQFKECLSALKPGGHMLCFAGTRTHHRMACNIEDAGFEIRDMIAWIYGSGFPKSMNVGNAVDKFRGDERKIVGQGKGRTGKKARPHGGSLHSDDNYQWPGKYNITQGQSSWEGWGTALKPAIEPITLARKPLSGTVAENIIEHGTGALNIDACRVPTSGGKLQAGAGRIPCRHDESVPRGRSGEPSATRRYRDKGSTDFAATPGPRSDTQDRWPANIIHDGSNEVAELFPDAPGMQCQVGPQYGDKDSVNCYGSWGPRKDFKPRLDSGSAARFFYCAKASRSERGAGNTHPTVKPINLVHYLINLILPHKGVVLDPWAGSGTTAVVCERFGLKWIGIEKELAYCEIFAKRLDAETKQLKLFA